LMTHQKCLQYLTNRCLKESSGYGYCVEFEEDLERECEEEEVLPGESQPCEMFSQLRTIVDARDPFAEAPVSPEVDPFGDSGVEQMDKNTTIVEADPAPVNITESNFDKSIRALPDQGFDEASNASLVEHHDFDTQTADWQREWPSWDETKSQSTDRICQDNPQHKWCQLWVKDRARSSPSSGGRFDYLPDGVAKGVEATVDQTEDAVDRAEGSLPDRMAPNSSDFEKKSDEFGSAASQEISNVGDNLPPGMVNKPDSGDQDVGEDNHAVEMSAE